jgi:hypothetical protein
MPTILSDEKRVFTQREVVRVLSGGRDSGNLNAYLVRNPLFSNQLTAGAIFEYNYRVLKPKVYVQ